MAYVPERGDIIHLAFDPASGREMKGAHYAVAITAKAFNQRGLAVVCPISQGAAEEARTHGLVVTLMGSGTATQGNIHCHQIKSLDWRARMAKFRERIPNVILEDVMARIEAMLLSPE
jgi:mRNA interferase ChpB